jgi:RND family efflux transporter MFP subunit
MRLPLCRSRSLGWGLLAALLLAGCAQPAPTAKEKKTEVIVTTPIFDTVLDYEDFTGRLDAFFTVDLRARVTGYIDRAPFKEGDPVQKDALIFEIDARPYRAIFDQATAELATRKAEAVRAEALYRRSTELLRTGASTQEDIDKQKGDAEVARAAILLAEAKLREAKLNLDFCRVTAPMSGHISRRFVDPGNLVRADDTMLTSIVADSKVYAYFDVDERTYLELVGENATATSSSAKKDLKLPVLMRLANGDDFTYRGDVDFLDNRVNGNTGTIRMRGVFENERGTLKSGLFVRVRLPIGNPYRALLVPDEAIQSDQGRKYVYVVKSVTDGTEAAKDVVEYRPVHPGQAIHGLRVIGAAKKDATGKVTEGLVDGERVIISGMQRVRPEAVVASTLQPPPKAPGFPLGKLLNLKPEPAGEPSHGK